MRPACDGAVLLCSCGVAPSVLRARRNGVRHGEASAALVTDCIPLINIAPFGGCTSPGNPNPPPLSPVKACVPNIFTLWSVSIPGITVDHVPVLDDAAFLVCGYGGIIRVQLPGQLTTRHAPSSSSGEPPNPPK